MIVFRTTAETYNYICISFTCTVQNFAIRYIKLK